MADVPGHAHDSAATATLTAGQRAAAAKLAFCAETPASVAVLCGPAGVGKSHLLSVVAGMPEFSGRCGEPRPLEELRSAATGAARRSDEILLVDDAHAAADGELLSLAVGHLRTRPRGGVVLAGQGRLLTLLARDERLERLTTLRATLQPFSRAESRLLVGCRLGAAVRRAGALAEPVPEDVADAIHEIAGGIPTAILRLADVAAMLAEARPDRSLVAADIETIHFRLRLEAA